MPSGSGPAAARRTRRRRPGPREEQRGELVAAEAARDVGLAERPGRAGGERPQEPVALLVPLAVVRLLEVVEVEEDEREPAAVAPGAGGLGGEQRVEGPVVEEPGERIAPRARPARP